MIGKEKCELLRLIRKQIAEANGIAYRSVECSYDGPCSGTCPKCDVEIRYLETQLKAKAANNEAISIEGLALDLFNDAISCSHIRKGTYTNAGGENDSAHTRPPLSKLRGHWDAKLDSPVEALDLPPEQVRALQNADITTVRQLTRQTLDQVAHIPGLGPAVARELGRKLNSLGLSFTEDFDILPGLLLINRNDLIAPGAAPADSEKENGLL